MRDRLEPVTIPAPLKTPMPPTLPDVTTVAHPSMFT
jgi:hypothetical protein